MAEHEFPSNSNANKAGSGRQKRLERVTTGEVVRKKRSLRKQFAETFVQGDFRSAANYMVMDIGLPMAQDLIVEAFQMGVEKLFKGDARRRGPVPPQTGPGGYINYGSLRSSALSNVVSMPQRAMNNAARARHDFDAIVIDSRSEAEAVIERLFDILTEYNVVTVAELYELVGIIPNHQDQKWGWTDLRGAKVSRMSGQYFLDLPSPHPL